jgi:hypothetical protein
MSARAVGWALEQPLEALPKIILVTLADCMNSETAKCVPSQEYLAKIALCSDRTVRTHLTALEEGGYITRVRRSHPATGQPEARRPAYRKQLLPGNRKGTRTLRGMGGRARARL